MKKVYQDQIKEQVIWAIKTLYPIYPKNTYFCFVYEKLSHQNSRQSITEAPFVVFHKFVNADKTELGAKSSHIAT